jgi:hypothetical protein
MWFLSNATSAPGTIRDRVCGDPELVAATVRVMSAGGGASLAAAATLRHISERYEYAPCLLRCGYTNNAPPHNDNNNDDNNEAAEGEARRRDLGAALRSFLRRSAARERVGGGGGGARSVLIGGGGGGGSGGPGGGGLGGGPGGGGIAGVGGAGMKGSGGKGIIAGVEAWRVAAALLSNVIAGDHERHVHEHKHEGRSGGGSDGWPLLSGTLPEIVVALSCSSDAATQAAVAPAVGRVVCSFA